MTSTSPPTSASTTTTQAPSSYPRQRLIHQATPLHLLHGLAAPTGVEVWVKRDDLTGSHLSGNKIRKLEYLLGDALAQGATDVITCGGVQSNHCRATAMAAVPLGMKAHLFLRTEHGRRDELPNPPTGNVLLDQLVGASIQTISRSDYGDESVRNACMAALADELRAAGRRPYLIVEGGSNALGALGYAHAYDEICESLGRAPTSVVAATGSGGTLAGLAIAIARRGASTRAVGINVCDSEAFFTDRVLAITAAAEAELGQVHVPAETIALRDFQGLGYAKSTPDELAVLRDTARKCGLVLDPVYSLKAFIGLKTLLTSEPELLGNTPVFIHTGGIFGLFPAAEQLAALL